MAYTPNCKVVWDEAKNFSNQKKHGLSFNEARTLFTSGVAYFEVFDDEHSGAEARFAAIGPIPRGMIFVVWTLRGEDTHRIITARMATRREIAAYRNNVRNP